MTPLIIGLYMSQQGDHGDALDLWVSIQFIIFQFLKDLGIPLTSMHSYLNVISLFEEGLGNLLLNVLTVVLHNSLQRKLVL